MNPSNDVDAGGFCMRYRMNTTTHSPNDVAFGFVMNNANANLSTTKPVGYSLGVGDHFSPPFSPLGSLRENFSFPTKHGKKISVQYSML